MPTTIFKEIDSLHSEWERMDKSARLERLAIEKIRLNRLANQFAQYLSVKGGFANDVERAYANRLLEMINMVDAEGAKVTNDIAREVFKEAMKSLMK